MHPNEKQDEPPELGVIRADATPVAPQIAPDGMPMPRLSIVAEQRPPPEMTPSTSPCLRGPCKHFMEVRALFEHGNAPGTFADGKEPKEFYLYCDAIPGTYLEMGRDAYPVSCSRWDPLAKSRVKLLEDRRRRFYVENPQHKPIDDADVAAAVADTVNDLDKETP